MDLVLIGVVAFSASVLTFFSGFGLGSLLLPVYAFFFPIEIAIGATAIVHFLNNLAKLSLIGAHGRISVLKKFGLMAFVFSFIGSFCLLWISGRGPIIQNEMFGKIFDIYSHKLVIGLLMISFVLFDRLKLKADIFSHLNLYLGGAISGFFGGFSGHQGALRSMFLIRLDLSKEQFIATGIWIAVFVDIARLSVYQNFLSFLNNQNEFLSLIIMGVCSAMLGSFLGRRLLKKVKFSFVNNTVSFGILLVAILLILGVV
jgi:uncharacterized protein